MGIEQHRKLPLIEHGQPAASQRLAVAMAANGAAYRHAVQTSAPGECWDYLVLTAANEKQAQVYRQELALRTRSVGPTGAFFPTIQRSIVVPDPPGRRAGSGGATLGVLRALSEQFHLTEADLASLRILVIHSGGASQRLPVYSPLGKIFSPLALLRPDGQICTLFDHLYLTMAGLPERLGPGLLIVAGDVFLVLDHRQVGAPAPGVTALTISVPAELGLGHGVFVTDEQGRIRHTLQKVSVAAMQAAGATDSHGNVLIDTGLLFFDVPSTTKVARLAGCSARRGRGLDQSFAGQIDLYEDITAALASSTERKLYLKEKKTAAMRKVLWDELHGVGFHAVRLDGEFLHLGTTRQFRDAMVHESASPAAKLFQQNILAHGNWRIDPGRRVYHTALLGENGRQGRIGEGSVVEHSILGPRTFIGSGSFVSQTIAVTQPLELGDELLFFQVPIRDKRGERLYAQVLCGVSDDFKGRFLAGPCLFLNKPIRDLLKRHGISAAEIWRGIAPDQRSLWTARLFPAVQDRDSAQAVLWFARPHASAAAIRNWRRLPRFSMADLLELSDPQAMIEHREIVAAYLQTGEMLDLIGRDEDRPVDTIIGHYSTAAAYEASLHQIAAMASRSAASPQAAIQQARALWCAGQLLQRPDLPEMPTARTRSEQHMTQAFARIAEASEIAVADVAGGAHAALRIAPGRRIEASSPVRLDLAGGWSDTPPYCYERGGHVVNVAIDLGDHAPVRAIVRTIREPMLILESNDLAQHVELRSMRQLEQRPDVRDPFALHKVALDLAGILPRTGSDIARHMKKLGGGLIVSTECRVPKGSGLGTSSILSATLLGALHAAVGASATHDELIRQTLLLEQRLSTGGGWQDQVGGIIGGVKSTTSGPGIPQNPRVEQLAMGEQQLAEFENRLVVYYSGQQRLARDILRRAMGRWLAREPAVLRIMGELKESAARLRAALLKGNWRASAQQVAAYWRLKKELYPGSTTPSIDVLFLSLQQHYLAAGLAGAGGGGFAYFVCSNMRQAQRLREHLNEQGRELAPMGNIYPARINRAGLQVSIT